MNEEEPYPDESQSLEDVRHMRLTAPLRDMIEGQGEVKAAKTLGVYYRTLVRAEKSEQLIARMSAALERHLLLGAARLPHSSVRASGSLRSVWGRWRTGWKGGSKTCVES